MKNQLELNIKSQYNADDYAINFYNEVYTMMRDYQGKILLSLIRRHLKQFDGRIKVDKYINGSHPKGTVCIMPPDCSVEVYVGISGQLFNAQTMEQLNEKMYNMLMLRRGQLLLASDNDRMSEAQRELETKLEELRSTLIKFNDALPMVCKTTNVGRHYLRDICALTFPSMGRLDMLTGLMDGALKWRQQEERA